MSNDCIHVSVGVSFILATRSVQSISFRNCSRYALALLGVDQLDQALEVLQPAIKAHPVYVGLWMTRGAIYYEKARKLLKG